MYSHGVAADPLDRLSITALAASDWVYLGASESGDSASVGLSAEWQASSRVFLGIEAHDGRPDRRRRRERAVTVYLGIGDALGPNWYASVAVAHRRFPDSVRPWDYTLLDLEVAHERWSFGVELAPNYYDLDRFALGMDATYTHPLGERHYAYLQGGLLEQSEGQLDYRFARLGFGTSLGAFNADVSYGWNDAPRGARLVGDVVESPRWVLELSYRLW